jgi:hypothetical protein
VAQATTQNVRRGWQVFAGSDRIGEVATVSERELSVKSGRLVKHEYVIPIELINDAADGVVDLKIGREDVAKLVPAK